VNARENPLIAPGDGRLLDRFLRHFRLEPGLPPAELLRSAVAAFARLPYENLTKIIKHRELPRAEDARRHPDEVLNDHIAYGAGGTCFALTATLLNLVRALRWQAEPLLADRRYGANTHCALLVRIDGRPHLVDPGYLIVDPIPLDIDAPREIHTAFNDLILTPRDGGRIDLATRNRGQTTYRLTFKTSPAEPGEFLRAWDASFDWEMMRYPVLSRVAGPRQLYLQGNRLQSRGHDDIARQELPPDQLAERMAVEFGIDVRLAHQALQILHRQGETHG
jgi:arylamine N-acetyltransferase